MSHRQRSPRQSAKRERYCVIKATTLEEILATCERHIMNIGKTQMDYIMEGDGTPTDDFYCEMFRDTWADLRDDVQEMLDKQNAKKIRKPKPQPQLVPPPGPNRTSAAFQLTLDCYRSGQMSAAQFVQHMQDPLFAAWYEKHK